MIYSELAGIFRYCTPDWTDKQRHDLLLKVHDFVLYSIPVLFFTYRSLTVRLPLLLISYLIVFLNLCNRGCFMTNFEREFKTFNKKKEVSGIINIIFSKFDWHLSSHEKVVAFTAFNLCFAIMLTFFTINHILLNGFV
jgi:hypothetical protein